MAVMCWFYFQLLFEYRCLKNITVNLDSVKISHQRSEHLRAGQKPPGEEITRWESVRVIRAKCFSHWLCYSYYNSFTPTRAATERKEADTILIIDESLKRFFKQTCQILLWFVKMSCFSLVYVTLKYNALIIQVTWRLGWTCFTLRKYLAQDVHRFANNSWLVLL